MVYARRTLKVRLSDWQDNGADAGDRIAAIPCRAGFHYASISIRLINGELASDCALEQLTPWKSILPYHICPLRADHQRRRIGVASRHPRHD
jgi:hypothetical protein